MTQIHVAVFFGVTAWFILELLEDRTPERGEVALVGVREPDLVRLRRFLNPAALPSQI